MNEAKIVAWARKWYIDGETPRKVRNENGRMVWPSKFKLREVSASKILDDDVPLVVETLDASKAQA